MKNLMRNLESEEQFYELKKMDQTMVFVFSANWCPDCLFIKSFMPSILQEYADYEFVYVDRDQFIDLCVDLEVLGIPSFIVTRNDCEKGRFVSKLRKTKEEVEAFFNDVK